MSILNLYAKPEYKMTLRERIRWWFKRRKYIKQRAMWGFSEYDAWNFHVYHSELVAKMMRYWANNIHSYHPEMAEEDWVNILKFIADCFAEYNRELPTPAYHAYEASVNRIHNEDGSISVECDDALLEAWRQEEMNNHNYKMARLKEGFRLLYEYYPHLWD